jgi:hypothetical protein
LIKDIGKQMEYWKDIRVWFNLINYIKKNKYSCNHTQNLNYNHTNNSEINHEVNGKNL